jgi:hypothetical protein
MTGEITLTQIAIVVTAALAGGILLEKFKQPAQSLAIFWQV